MKHICLAAILLLSAYLCIAQTSQSNRPKKETLPSILFKRRFQRAIHLDNIENKNLTNLYNSTDSNVSIITLVLNAVAEHSIQAYYHMKDSNAFLSKEQVTQILTDTKALTGTDFNAKTINTLIILKIGIWISKPAKRKMNWF